jgi:class 3 adenylate cyclase/ligand-binding sensor domain-containing protein
MKNYTRTLLLGLIVCLGGTSGILVAQSAQYQFKVYDLEDGLSHRDVFKIAQDNSGFIWVATMDGLNRFDGYEFERYHSRSDHQKATLDVISDMSIGRNNELWLAGQNHVSTFITETHQIQTRHLHTVPLNPRASVPKIQEQLTPHNLFQDTQGALWMAALSGQTGKVSLQRLDENGKLVKVASLKGKAPHRPIVQFNGYIFVGAQNNELWLISPQFGRLESKIILPGAANESNQIVHLHATGGKLWILTSSGQVYTLNDPKSQVELHPINQYLPKGGLYNSMLIDPLGNIWLAGQGKLWHFITATNVLENYDERVRFLLKSMPNYRQVFRDRSGVIWVASDYGVIKIVESEKLFSQYLAGGNENCRDIQCSIRGMAEDEQGRVYLSYYNSIHVLDPASNSLRLLFPYYNFSNLPFGLHYFNGYLYTGNGWQIDTKKLTQKKLFPDADREIGGVVTGDAKGMVWFGYGHNLYQFDPKRKKLQRYRGINATWSVESGEISFLQAGRNPDILWIGTIDQGLYQLNTKTGKRKHFFGNKNSQSETYPRRINCIFEDRRGVLWLGTDMGLQKINLQNRQNTLYNQSLGLSNDIVTAILPEGDSCLWVSTYLGLNRMSIRQERFISFMEQDGLSNNEFNRISALRTRNSRLYFGGLDGVNAFFPGPQFWKKETKAYEAPLLFTKFSHYSGELDTIFSRTAAINKQRAVFLRHNDRYFTISFAAANYREPNQNHFAYMLENYDRKWSPFDNEHTVMYSNIPAGNYVFRVKAITAGSLNKSSEMSIDMTIEQAFYKSWPFIITCILFIIGCIYAFLRYRIYTIRKREKALERLVRMRTSELEEEKHKSDQLLLNILPAQTAEELKTTGKASARRYEHVTVMFTDFKGFSSIAEQMEPEELVREIDHCFGAFDAIIDRYGLEKIKTIGDAYMCMEEGIDYSPAESARRVVMAALDIQVFLKETAEIRRASGQPAFEARIGIHSGPVVAGVVGTKKFAYDIWGDTVNIASRMESEGEAGKVNVSETTYQLLNGDFTCQNHGQFTDRDKDIIEMYFVSHIA